LPPTSPLLKHQFRIRLLAVHTTRFFPPLYFHFNYFLNRWSLTSNVTPTANSNSDSPARDTHHSIFTASLPPFYLFLEVVEPNFKWHPYTHIKFEFLSSPYLPYDFFPPLYLHFKFFLKRRKLISYFTPTTTSDSDSPPRLTYPSIFPTSLPPF